MAQNQSEKKVLNFYIHGAERDILGNKLILKVVEERVHCLIIGTHSSMIHVEMQTSYPVGINCRTRCLELN